MSALRVAIHFRVLSPYSLARVNAAAERFCVIGIEGARRSALYPWEPRDSPERFERRTLFYDRPIEMQSPAEIVSATETVLDETDPDIVCITGWSHCEALTMLRWARRKRRPAILLSESTANDAPRSFWREALKRRIVSLCDAAVVGGEPQRAYAEALGMSSDRIFLGYDAVDNDFFAKGAAAARREKAAVRARFGLPERFFVASSRFIAKKNLPRLLEAFAVYRGRTDAAPWDLVLLGDGELRGALEARASALGISEAVHFMGFKQYDDLPAFYGLAGAFVHLSTVEQWGLVVNEAMAVGLPVVVSQSCGCAIDLVRHGVNGWQVDPNDTHSIAEALCRMAAPETDRCAMAEAGRQIIARYGPDRFGDGIAAAITAAQGKPLRRAGPLSHLLLSRLALRRARD
jgi:glycosyltransferase involved in cell wall biosynthesis